MQDTRTDNTLLDLITCIRKHLLGMVLIFAGVVAVAIIMTLKQTPIFEVESRILVKYGREYIYHSVEGSQKGDVSPFLTYNTDTIINTELEIFRSPELAEEVITTLGVERIFPGIGLTAGNNTDLLTRAVSRFGTLLDVFHVKGSSVVGVAFQHQNPDLAVEVVNLLVERFKERHLEIFKNPQFQFLEEQVAQHRSQLLAMEEKEIAFKKEHRIFSLENQRKGLMQQYVSVNTMLIKENINLQESASKMNALEQQLEKTSSTVIQTEGVTKGGVHEASEMHLLQLKLKEKDLLEKYPEDNRLVVAVREDLAMVEDFLSGHGINLENIQTGKNPLYLKLESDLADAEVNHQAQQKRIASFKVELERLQERLQEFSGLEIELNRITTQHESVADSYKALNEKLAETRIQNAMDSEKMVNIVVIENPRVPVKPIKPNKQLRILVGIILAGASSLFYALFVEYALARKV